MFEEEDFSWEQPSVSDTVFAPTSDLLTEKTDSKWEPSSFCFTVSNPFGATSTDSPFSSPSSAPVTSESVFEIPSNNVTKSSNRNKRKPRRSHDKKREIARELESLSLNDGEILRTAYQVKDIEKIKQLLDDLRNGQSLTYDFSKELSPLALAYREGNQKFFELLKQFPSIDPLMDTFSQACKKGDFETVKELLQSNVYTKDPKFFLSCCSLESGNIEIAKLILGVEKHYPSKWNFLEKSLLYALRTQHHELKNMLIECISEIDMSFMDEHGLTSFHYACNNGDIHMIQELMKQEAQFIGVLNQSTRNYGDDESKDTYSGFFLAVTAGHHELVKLILSFRNERPCGYCLNANIGFPFYHSFQRKDLEMIKILLTGASVDPNLFPAGGFPALIEACSNNHFELVELLLTGSKVDINIEEKMSSGLSEACKNNNKEIAQLFLNNPEFRPSESVQVEHFSIYNAAALNCNILTNTLRSDDRFNPNSKSADGKTPIIRAVTSSITHMKAILKDPRIDINIQDTTRGGNMLLNEICQSGTPDMLELVLQDRRLEDLEDEIIASALHTCINQDEKDCDASFISHGQIMSKFYRFDPTELLSSHPQKAEQLASFLRTQNRSKSAFK